MKTITSQNRTGNVNKAAEALAQLNAQIAELQSRRVTLAEPLKARHAEIVSECREMESQIRELDPEWRPVSLRPKAEDRITEILTAKGQPMAAEEIIAAVGDAFTAWKVKTVLKKRSQGAKAVFTLADGKYAVKPA